MGVPLIQKFLVGKYILGQRFRRRQRYPLVLMLEPLFRCNLACAGCGKIAYPDDVLDRRLSLDECLGAVDESGVPIVSIVGGEPMIHPELPQIVEGIVSRRRFVYLCTNGLLLERHLDRYQPSKFLTFSVHLDGLREQHDQAVCREGVFDRATSAIRAATGRGFRVTINCTLFEGADPDRVAEFFDFAMELGAEGINVSPGFNYERAPRQHIYLKRNQSKQLFRGLFARGRSKRWQFNQSSLFLDFLAGNQTYQCTPWGNPTRNVFGWQKPCYLLVSEGYAPTFASLLDDTDWDSYGVGKNTKCAQCQVHCGFEPTAVNDAISHPLRALRVALFGVRTSGPYARDVIEDSVEPTFVPAPPPPVAAPIEARETGSRL